MAREPEEVNRELTAIAREKLHVDTLEKQYSDALDFHDVPCWAIKAALLAAYNLGRQDGQSE